MGYLIASIKRIGDHGSLASWFRNMISPPNGGAEVPDRRNESDVRQRQEVEDKGT